MPIHNRPAAQAFLRLFDLNLSADSLENAIPVQLRNAVQTILFVAKAMDTERQGELFCSAPTVELLTAAYQQGVRLSYDILEKMQNNKLVEQRVFKILLHGEGVGSIPVASAMYGEVAVTLFNKLLSKIVTLNQPIAYEVKTLGETILNQLSIKRASDKRRSLTPGFCAGVLHDDCIINIGVKKDLKLPTLNVDAVQNTLEKILNGALRTAGYGNASIVINVCRAKLALAKYPMHTIGDRSYSMEKTELELQVILKDSNSAALHRMSLSLVLDAFNYLVADLAADKRVLSTKEDTLQSKVTFFNCYQKTQNNFIPLGVVSKEEMDNLLKLQ